MRIVVAAPAVAALLIGLALWWPVPAERSLPSREAPLAGGAGGARTMSAGVDEPGAESERATRTVTSPFEPEGDRSTQGTSRPAEEITVSGRITLAGAPLAGELVSLDHPEAEAPLFRRDLVAAWERVSSAGKALMTLTDAEGRFRLRAPVAGPCRLQVGSLASWHPGVVRTREVVAPTTQADLDVRAARLRLEVRSTAGSSIQSWVRVTSEATGSRWPCWVPAGGQAVIVAPGVSYRIRAERVTSVAEVTIPGLLPGELLIHPLQLERRERDPRLTLCGASALGLESVGLRLFPTDATHEGPIRRSPWTAMSPRSSSLGDERLPGDSPLLTARRVASEEYLAREVPVAPGPWLFLVLPPDSGSCLLPIEGQVVLPERGEAQVLLDGSAGGRLDVTVQDAIGTTPCYSWRLRDAGGRTILSRTTWRSGTGVVEIRGIEPLDVEIPERDPRARRRHHRREAEALSVGCYELEVVSHGYASVQRSVALEEGCTTRELVVLVR